MTSKSKNGPTRQEYDQLLMTYQYNLADYLTLRSNYNMMQRIMHNSIALQDNLLTVLAEEKDGARIRDCTRAILTMTRALFGGMPKWPEEVDEYNIPIVPQEMMPLPAGARQQEVKMGQRETLDTLILKTERLAIQTEENRLLPDTKEIPNKKREEWRAKHKKDVSVPSDVSLDSLPETIQLLASDMGFKPVPNHPPGNLVVQTPAENTEDEEEVD